MRVIIEDTDSRTARSIQKMGSGLAISQIEKASSQCQTKYNADLI
jgi:hypothetical protein